jgi:RND family efflux transporter MFP subunit
VVLVSALLTLVACERPTVSPEPSLTVTVYRVGSAVVKGERTFHGRVAPADLTRVAFRIPGKISKLSVQAGQKVEQGQVVAAIEDSIQQQVLVDARAQHELSRRQLERARKLFDIDALTPAQKDELDAAYRLAQANLDLAQAQLSYTVIRAPFKGIVADVNKELFEAVAPGETVVSVYRDDRVDVLVDLPDDLPARFHRAPNRRAYQPDVMFAGNPQTYTMQFLKGSGARDPKTQAFQLWYTMPANGGQFPPGLPVTVKADLAKAGFASDAGIIVPVTALDATSEPGLFRVWRYAAGTIEPLAVNVERVSREGALVTGGLAAGDLVATSGLYRLSPGLAVDVRLAEQE